MKKNILLPSLLAVGISLLAGCKKQLNVEPSDLFTAGEAVRNIGDLRAGYYTAQARNNRENTMFIGAVASDEIFIGANNAGQGQFENRFQYSQDVTTGGGVTAGWGSYYSMLQQTNTFLVVADTITKKDATEIATVNQIKGQLLTLRAMAHFELLERYGQNVGTYDPNSLAVPVVTTPLNQFAAPARNTAGEVIAQIETDLRNAWALLPAANTAATFSDTSISRLTVTAFHARVALHKRAWQQAIDSATVVINSNVRPLTDSARLFAQIWQDSTLNTEVLYRVKRSGTTVGEIWTTTTGAVYYSPSNKLRGTFVANDIRVLPYFNGLAGTMVRKFFQSALGGRRVDVKYMRTAEMYLIRAEAYAELGNITLGAADLNFLRSKRIPGYVNATFATSQALVDAVLLERFKELCFEGFRFFDLKRRGLAVDRLPGDVTSLNWQTLPAGNFRFALPIPVAELQANSNIKQNPGY